MYALILINVYVFHEVLCLYLIYQKQVNTISEQMSYNPTAHIEIQLAPKYKHALYSRQHSETAPAGAGAQVHIVSPLLVIILITERE